MTGLPANYLSHSALPVSTWLAQSSEILLIPMLIFGVVLMASSSVGGVSRNLVERFENMREMTGSIRLVFAPLVVAMVTPAVFILLLTLLSRPESGGFQTSLTNDPSHLQAIYMLGSSFLLTTSFIGRESLILRLESVRVGNEGLDQLIGVCQAKMKEVQELLDLVSRWVPSMNLGAEARSMSEYSGYLADVRRQVVGASVALVSQLQAQLDETVLQPLTELPELLRKRVAGEIRGLISATATANSQLEEAKVSLRYPDIPAVSDTTPLVDMVPAYEAAIAEIRGVTTELSDLYRKESAAIDILMGQEEVAQPVSAMALLDSNDFVDAMKLVAEEYWLNFHLRWAEQIEQKKAALLTGTKELEQAVGEEDRQRVPPVVRVIEAARPANSTATLDGLRELRVILQDVVGKTATGSDRVGEMLESLEIRSITGLRFETVNRLAEIQQLKKKFEIVSLSFDSLTKFLENAVGILKSQSEAWKSDRDNLVVLAQYPLAKKIIDKMLKDQTGLALSKLPYQRKAASLYAQLYATATPGVEYDEKEESLKVKA